MFHIALTKSNKLNDLRILRNPYLKYKFIFLIDAVLGGVVLNHDGNGDENVTKQKA